MDKPTATAAGTAGTYLATSGRDWLRSATCWSSLSSLASSLSKRRFAAPPQPLACAVPVAPWPCAAHYSHPENESVAGKRRRSKYPTASRNCLYASRPPFPHIRLRHGLVQI